ncbi:MAG TPA: septum formation initiator family protein [Gammaproteobacteria bacterium]|nr:septum formation initiator family protein [Gammaproteobacteria bacterium]
MLRNVTIILAVIFCLLEYRFLFSSDSIVQVMRLKKSVATQVSENSALQQRNELIAAKISYLKKSAVAIEEHARYELGMIKRGEKYYQVVEPIE